MKKLLSLPPNLVKQTPNGNTVFHEITGLPTTDYFCTCDPEGSRVGSGGGTAWLLQQAWINEESRTQDEESGALDEELSFDNWLEGEKRILVHAGGQSRRLPAYAPSGKALMPIPVFRWSRGQRIGQDLLSLQLPLYEQIMQSAPSSLHTMVVSGDVFIRTTQSLPSVPEADVVCYGLWLDASVATHHGVFLMDRNTPGVLKQMLQKPSVADLHDLQGNHFFLTDIGVWLLSDRAVKLLMERSGIHLPPSTLHQSPTYYDLYSDFGRCLGTDPQLDDPELRQLTVAVLPLTGGEFYHFGTSRDMIASTLRLQNVVSDQREIMHHDRKPHPSIFVQNAVTKIPFTAQNTNIWIENSCVGPHWQLTHDHIITGVPENDWHIALQPGECIDVVPIDDDLYALRRYHIDDRFDGDEQQREQFPVVTLDELVLQPSTLHPPLSAIHYPLSTIHPPLYTLHYPLSTIHYPLNLPNSSRRRPGSTVSLPSARLSVLRTCPCLPATGSTQCSISSTSTMCLGSMSIIISTCLKPFPPPPRCLLASTMPCCGATAAAPSACCAKDSSAISSLNPPPSTINPPPSTPTRLSGHAVPYASTLQADGPTRLPIVSTRVGEWSTSP